MTTFVLWTCILLGIEILSKVICLGAGLSPQRGPGMLAAEAILCVCLLAWGISVLAGR